MFGSRAFAGGYFARGSRLRRRPAPVPTADGHGGSGFPADWLSRLLLRLPRDEAHGLVERGDPDEIAAVLLLLDLA